MSIRQGNKIIAGQPASGVDLFDFKWADHRLDNPSWLRADTFSWHSGDVYVAAYNHLLNEWNAVGNVATVDVIDGIMVPYRLSADGHKICGPDQEATVSAIYNKTGVAWYYIIDVANKQFKLPRTKWGFVGLRGSLAAYIAAGVPNITGSVTRNLYSNTPTATGSFVQGSTSDTNIRNDGGGEPAGTLSFDASLSSSVYGNSNTVQPPATQMYLYFYVGNFEKEALKQTAGLNAEMFGDKVDLPTGKAQSDVDLVIESQLPTSDNGYTWYRKYKSGWVEQGGRIPLAAGNGTTYVATVVMAVVMADTTYSITTTSMAASALLANSTNATRRVAGMLAAAVHMNSMTTTQFNVSKNDSSETIVFWQVSGVAA